jgi:hypothetical protein
MNVLKIVTKKTLTIAMSSVFAVMAVLAPMTASACPFGPHWWRHHHGWHHHGWRHHGWHHDDGAGVALGLGLIAGAAIIASTANAQYNNHPCYVTYHHGEPYRVCKE